MSDKNRTRYEVQKILADSIRLGLTTYLGANHGFSVMEFAQASFQNGDRIALINPVRTRRVGWQTSKYPVVSDALQRTEEWLEEQHWQIHIILKKKQNPEITDLQADDVAATLISWFNAVGCEEFRKHNCANLRIGDDSIIVYNDDSELYQKRAVFTLKLQVPKELSIHQVDFDTVMPKIKPV